MQNYGYTPNQIADMSIEQQILGFKDMESANPKIVHCSNIQEARRFLQELKNVKS